MTELWGSEEIGRELGVTPRRARQISQTYSSFPIPEVQRKGVRLWRADIVRMWVERHGGRTSGRPPKVGRVQRDGLARVFRSSIARRGISAMFIADELHVPLTYVESIVEGTTSAADWPSPSFLREFSHLVDQHPCVALEAAGYVTEAQASRGTFGKDNVATQALADSLRREFGG